MGEEVPDSEAPSVQPRRMSRAMWAALALGLVLALGGIMGSMLLSPGQVIRSELKSAAADLRRAQGGPDIAALRRHFPRHAATIDAKRWPQVQVTLHGLPRDICIDAARDAARIEGLVVIELERYGSGQQCAASNDLTWRFMP